MLYLIEFLFNKNSEQYDRHQISAQTKHTAQIFNFCNKKKDIKFCVNHHSKFMVIEYAYSIYIVLYGESIIFAHIIECLSYRRVWLRGGTRSAKHRHDRTERETTHSHRQTYRAEELPHTQRHSRRDSHRHMVCHGVQR